MLNILGIGGHAKVIIQTVFLQFSYQIIIFDDDTSKHGLDFYGFKVQGSINEFIYGPSVIAIGNNKIRNFIANKSVGASWVKIIHPSAVISTDVVIGEGTIVMAGSIIQPGAIVGKHCIINTGSCIDHDCIIGDFVHVAPNCAIAGGVKIGEGTFVGIGTSIIPNVEIGKWTTIGAGSAVICNIPDNCLAVGVPAIIKKETYE